MKTEICPQCQEQKILINVRYIKEGTKWRLVSMCQECCDYFFPNRLIKYKKYDNRGLSYLGKKKYQVG